jgi:hypothetical protein
VQGDRAAEADLDVVGMGAEDEEVDGGQLPTPTLRLAIDVGPLIARVTHKTPPAETLNIVTCPPDGALPAAIRELHKSHQLSCYLRLAASIQCACEPSWRRGRLTRDACCPDFDPR